ncbi:methyl-accepting chemotaxis protein [Shinella granuli]|uniref:Methyl-accepting chemotaxis protein n=1 Tax=Shinella granuli TaxID=323621 RepID=A0A4V2RH49_SHIGR|nr:HAMP domain-containing methyl-accepting chemotaxis protein [Shinella granuli]TCN38920.1 methyl-accepting chemotaxis protein [Shinella granuli]
MFEKLLSRVRIQTKVFIFIIPFILSIAAVGVTGFYTSGLLQARMEISNSVLQALSGFRDLSAAMARFLEAASEESRDQVAERLVSQQSLLREGLQQLDPTAEGRDDLERAVTSIDGISARMGSLWDLHVKTTALANDLQRAQSAIVSAQFDIAEGMKVVQRTADEEETVARNQLRDADRVTELASFAARLREEVTRATDPEAKFAAVSAGMKELIRHQRMLGMSLPSDETTIRQVVADVATKLKSIVEANDISMERAAGLEDALGSLVAVKGALEAAADQKIKQATKTFAESVEPVEKARTAQRDGQKLINSAYAIQILMARFTMAPSEHNLQRLLQEFAGVRRDLDTLEKTAGEFQHFGGLKNKMLPALDAIEKAGAELVKANDQRLNEFTASAVDLDQTWQQLTAYAELQRQTAAAERRGANSISAGAISLGIAISVLAGIGLTLTFKGPISQITGAMRRLAEGKLETAIVGDNRIDEIGDMARALGVFKNNALAKVEIEERSNAERVKAEEERLRNDADKREVERQIDFAVSALAAGLARLAHGDISHTIETPFFGRLEQLRTDFNSSLLRLQDTVTQIRSNTQMIEGNAGEMSLSAVDLARRTEQQAVALEEVAAAVEQITATVRASAVQAEEANQIIAETKRTADASSEVVVSAIDAMAKIEEASTQIVQIIAAIDEIAFQTNLLALNAGIEAARADEAGKGFAVVAQEVRELAQRSADAAQEIKELIARSNAEIVSGARVVQETSSVLGAISSKVVTVSQQMAVIARASREQSTALDEVNASINTMDQMTQQNAAMVEETNTATSHLAMQTKALMSLVAQFNLPEARDDVTVSAA